MLDPILIPSIKLLWEFNQVHNDLEPADLILVLGSNDLSVPAFAAQVFTEKFANKIIISGGVGINTKYINQTEAAVFEKIILDLGVTKADIFLEDKSSNTGENIIFSYNLIKKLNLKADKIIIISKSYTEKRILMTFKKQWPNTKTKVIVTSPPQTFNELLLDPDILDAVNSITKNTQRLKIYPEKGFSNKLKIPTKVWQAYEFLTRNSFDKYFVK